MLQINSTVLLFVFLHRAPKCIGALYILHSKARILNLVTLAYRFGTLLYFSAPMQRKHVEPHILGHMPYTPYVCQAEGASIIGGGAPP